MSNDEIEGDHLNVRRNELFRIYAKIQELDLGWGWSVGGVGGLEL